MGGVFVLALAIFTLQVFYEFKNNSAGRIFMTTFLIEKNLPKPLQNIYQKLIQKHNKISFWNDDIQQRSVWGYVDRHSIILVDKTSS